MFDQPLYVQINFWLLISSAAVAFLLCCLPPRTRQRYIADGREVDLPAVPTVCTCRNPQAVDVLLTLFYIGSSTFLFAYSYCLSFWPEDVEAEDITAVDQWFNSIFPLFIYLPLVLRYVTINGMQCRFNSRNIALTILSLGLIYIASLLISTSGLVEWLMRITGTPLTQQAVESLQHAPDSHFLPMAMGAVVVAPIIEEIFFRGFIFRVLSARVGMLTGALVSSLFFGAVHVSLIQTLLLTIFGIVQCRLYVKTGSIIYPMLMHMLFNSLSVLSIYLHIMK